jgi:hypothetical protein
MVKGKRVWFVTGILAGLVATMAAQARPDFSGTWVEDRERFTNLLAEKPVDSPPTSGGALALALGETVVTQTADALTIERKVPQSDRPLRYVYKLDGSTSVNHNGAQTRTTTSRWEGTRLVTEGTIFQATSHGETSWGIREVLFLEKGELMQESEWTQGGKVTTANRRVYGRAGR